MPSLFLTLFPSFLFMSSIDIGSISEPLSLQSAIGAQKDVVECRSNHFPILMYHHIRDYQKIPKKAAQDISVSPKEFQAQLEYLHTTGYKTITSKDIIDNSVPCKSIMITFDDGYYDVYENAFPIMSQYNYTWVIGLIVARMDESDYLFWSDIRALEKAWWELASHTWDHSILPQIQKQRLPLEIRNSKTYLEKWFQTSIKIFIYPGWFYGPDSLETVRQANYGYALTTRFGEADLGNKKLELRRINITPGVTPEKLEDMLEMATLLQ